MQPRPAPPDRAPTGVPLTTKAGVPFARKYGVPIPRSLTENKPKVTGKALRVNDNNADERDRSSSPPEPRSGDKSRKVGGNALRVNDNSVEGEEPPATRKE